jgi:hypothetical protein
MLRANQYDIGITALFADSIGLAPFKDNFWSKSVQPGNKYSISILNPNWISYRLRFLQIKLNPALPSKRRFLCSALGLLALATGLETVISCSSIGDLAIINSHIDLLMLFSMQFDQIRRQTAEAFSICYLH